MTLESTIQAQIERAIGAEPDLLLLRNSVGVARHVDEKTGRARVISYGLLAGSPDLVAILAPWGRWFCLELKTPRGRAGEHQLRAHEAWRRFGALVYVVRSVDEARAALAHARNVCRSEQWESR